MNPLVDGLTWILGCAPKMPFGLEDDVYVSSRSVAGTASARAAQKNSIAAARTAAAGKIHLGFKIILLLLERAFGALPEFASSSKLFPVTGERS
jgi:hypothetical protein